MFRLLHLSDIHIGKTYKDSESIACKIATDIAHHAFGNIECIVVTGDIFDGKAGAEEYIINEAVIFFEVLLEEINNNQDGHTINKEDIIFVPGNHDLVRVDDVKERWDKYHKFLEQFYGTIPSFYNKENYSLLKTYHDHKIAFVGLNSCQIEKKKLFNDKYINKFRENIDAAVLEAEGIQKSKIIEMLEKSVADEYDDFGEIRMSQITPLRREIKKLDNYNIIAFFHHHFYLFPEIAPKIGDTSLIRNYSDVIQQLKYMNVGIVLHGHKHFDLERPFIEEDYYDSLDNIIYVFSGGSVGTERTEKHTFSVLDIYDKKSDIRLKHNKFVYNGEVLSILRKQIPPQKIMGRIVKLFEILKQSNYDAYKNYIEIAMKSNEAYEKSQKVIEWISEAITGFTDVYEFLEDDFKNILFLLYAVNYRVINYKAIVENNNSYFESHSKYWRKFYNDQLVEGEFCVSEEEYHKLFGIKKLKDITKVCDEILNKYENRKTSILMAFTMLGIFFSDLYLVMTEYADDFKESISYKVNIKIEENKFHENVPVPMIEIKSDADRRSVYVQMLCNEATAHKMAVLFVKEFDLLINKFEDYFKIIGLKLYYLSPKIDKDSMKNPLDNYNFEAYIPTLLPLLTGDNIYPSKVVFARELIQNSIDAIAVREAKDTREFSKIIRIEIGEDQKHKRYFKITDNGTGMDRYKIERYFTSIGRSFYSGKEYEDLKINYKPISNFGIGFLSSFMVCQEIDVKTKYYLDGSESLKLHIPNYDGCFFVELDKEKNIGTELKLYLNCELSNQEIVNYLIKSMLDIKYNISIKYLDNKGNKADGIIYSRLIRRRSKNEYFKFFIPLTEKGEVLKLKYEDVLNNEFINECEYGIFIKKRDREDRCSHHVILNAGILVEQARVADLFDKKFYKSALEWGVKKNFHNCIYINFPSNWLQVDVSRENVTGFTDMVVESNTRNNCNVLGENIAAALYEQIVSFLDYAKREQKNLPLIYLQEVIEYAINFLGRIRFSSLYTKLKNMQYHLIIEFTSNEIIYRVGQGEELESMSLVRYNGNEAKKTHGFFRKRIRSREIESHPQEITIGNESYNIHFRDIPRFLEEVYRKGFYGEERHTHRPEDFIKQSEVRIEGGIGRIFENLTVLLLELPDKAFLNRSIYEKGDRNSSLICFIEYLVLQNLTISNANKGIAVKYKDIEKKIM